MSTREQFEQSWASRFTSETVSISPMPSLSCWDSNGGIKSDEAVRDELERCRQRIAELRRRIENEEFLETFCEQWLDELEKQKTSVASVSKKAGDLDKLSLQNENGETVSINGNCNIEALLRDCKITPQPQIEDEYSSPADFCQIAARPESPENAYAEPFMPPQLKKFVESPMKSTQVNVRDSKEKIQTHNIAEQDQQANDEVESDDDNIANLLALRQSVSRFSQFCIDSGSTRQQLEVQAQRLSNRFSCMFEKKNSQLSIGSGNGFGSIPHGSLDTVEESLLSPATAMSGNYFLPFTSKCVSFLVQYSTVSSSSLCWNFYET
jgi:hypothetical protein